jgi:hypothetical protein
MTTTTARKTRSSSRTTLAPAPLTAEQIEARAAREASTEAYLARRYALIAAAYAIAQKLAPGRVTHYGEIERMDDFCVMFGPATAERTMLAGPGVLQLDVGLSSWSRLPESDEFPPVSLEFRPRAYSLGSETTMDACEAQGRAMLDAAAFARVLVAMTA